MDEKFNPYRAPGYGSEWPQTADLKRPREQLSPSENRGRVILLVHIALVLAISLAVMAVVLAIQGPGRLRVQAVRFVLNIALFYWLYRGSAVAKWISVVLYLLATMAGTYGLLLMDDFKWIAVLAGMRFVYASLVVVLLGSPSVQSFLRYQARER